MPVIKINSCHKRCRFQNTNLKCSGLILHLTKGSDYYSMLRLTLTDWFNQTDLAVGNFGDNKKELFKVDIWSYAIVLEDEANQLRMVVFSHSWWSKCRSENCLC